MVWLLDSRRRADPGGGRIAVRRHRAPVPRGGDQLGRDPAGRRADGTVRRRHRVHPRARRLRADGQGAGLDGARRPAPGPRRGRRGRHPGGARRLARALPQVRRRRPRGRADDPACIDAIKQYLSLLPAELRGAAADRAHRRPDRPRRRGAARRAARVEPQAVRHVRGDPPDRRRRRLLRPQAAVRQDDHHLPGAVRRPARPGSSPTSPSSSAGSSTTTRPTRRRASSTSATRTACRSCT